jgi:hypothetical protein
VKEKSLALARILECWEGLVDTVTYKMLAQMRKEQNTVAKPIYVGVRDVFSSTHSQRPEEQFQVEVFERSCTRLHCYKTDNVRITHH